LAKDVTSQVWIQFLLKVTLGVSSILLARHLSATDNGLLGTAWQYVAFAQFLTDMGFNTVPTMRVVASWSGPRCAREAR
jgi:O-antigen/teichoic acid export membrane protein